MASTDVYFENLTNISPMSAGSPGVSVLDYVGYVVVPLTFILGLVGNTFTIRVMLTKSFRSLPVSKMLIALSLSDTVVNLMFPFNKPIVRRLLGADARALSSAGCKLFFCAYRYAKISSSWMVVLISCERFVAVLLHTKAKIINTTRNAYIGMAIVYGTLAVLIGYWCSWADDVVNGGCMPNVRTPGMEHQIQAFLVLGLSLYAYIPAAILLVLNSSIICKLFKIRKRTRSHVAPSRASAAHQSSVGSKTTIMLVCIAVAFVVLVTPNASSHLVSTDIFQTTDTKMVYLREISQILEQLNSSINFILYILCSQRFRERVVILCRVHKTKSSGRPSGSDATKRQTKITSATISATSGMTRTQTQSMAKPPPVAGSINKSQAQVIDRPASVGGMNKDETLNTTGAPSVASWKNKAVSQPTTGAPSVTSDVGKAETCVFVGPLSAACGTDKGQTHVMSRLPSAVGEVNKTETLNTTGAPSVVSLTNKAVTQPTTGAPSVVSGPNNVKTLTSTGAPSATSDVFKAETYIISGAEYVVGRTNKTETYYMEGPPSGGTNKTETHWTHR